MDSSSYELSVEGYVGKKLVFTNRTALEFSPKSFSIFIQMDKPKYKPGQGVKIRVVSVYADLKPCNKQVDIGIKDPQGNLIQQWLSLDSRLGTVSVEFQLSDNPPLGSWSIEASVNGVLSIKQFTVTHYVLPKFEVTIQVPDVLYVEDRLSGTVIAQYNYGKSVKGNMTVTFALAYYSAYNITKATVIDGSANFTFSLREFGQNEKSMKPPYEQGTPFSLIASVTESLTGLTENTIVNVTAVFVKYNMQFYGHSSVLKPSLSFTTWLKICSYNNEPLSAEERKNNVTVIIAQSKLWTGDTEDFLSSDFFNDTTGSFGTYDKLSYAVPKSGIITIQLKLIKNMNTLNIQAQFLSGYGSLGLSNTYLSPSHSYIQLKKPADDLQVGTPFQMTFESNNPFKEFNYLVMSRGQIVTAGKEQSTSFRVIPEPSWAPLACMIVYYVKDDGEIVTDSQQFSIADIFKNKVSLKWSKTQAEPSESVSLAVTVAEPKSLVGILVVDKGTQVLNSVNDFTEDMVREELTAYTEHMSDSQQKGMDAFSTFKSCNLVVLTDAHLSEYYGTYLPTFDNAEWGFRPEVAMPKEPRLRSNFPETWIWVETNLSSSNTTSLDVTVPDSITSWIASAFVISENLGLGLSTVPARLNVIQTFFLSLNLPYSIIRGEQLVIEVIIFNYLDQPLEVMVIVAASDSFDFVFPQIEGLSLPGKQTLSVPSQDGTSVLFPIKPKVLGEIPISVKAISSVASDAIVQKVLVKPEGIEQAFAKSLFLDLALNEISVSKEINFSFPTNVVEGSEKAYITVFGDILGPSISGLESLIQMPYGCGEQNMINFAPNIYVLKYLTATNQVKRDIQSKAVSYMIDGYQRELSYQRVDGSFSAFGNSDSSGSTWLSAFVLRCFLQARPFIAIEQNVLFRTVQWLVTQQAAGGEFEEPGRVIHTELQGGQNGPLALTAYVLMALLEDYDYMEMYSSVVYKALAFLENKLSEGIPSNYTLCLVTYALSLAEHPGAVSALDELRDRADKKGDIMVWRSSTAGLSNSWQPRSTDIEMVAYVLLSYFRQNRLLEGISLMKWLSQQRNHLGGYASTQDTIIALQALSEYAVYSGANTINIMVKVSAPGLPTPATFHIDSTNYLLRQSQKVGVLKDMQVNVSAEGIGFAITQLNVFYNVKSDSSARSATDIGYNEAFDLRIKVIDNKDDLNHVSLHICIRLMENQGISQTGMALMEVGLLSGFMLVRDGIATGDFIRNVEISPGKVILYLDSVSTTQMCVDIPAVRDSKIANAQDAVVLIYDYYEPRRKTVRTYNSEVMRSMSSCSFCRDDCSTCGGVSVGMGSSKANLLQHFGVISTLLAGILIQLFLLCFH
ncbi:CD109 protein, partial [Amia calva]|nr:CD109 protein [Amia calva]